MRVLAKIVTLMNKAQAVIGGVVLVLMVVLTCGNIVIRLFDRPISGTYELMGLFGAVVTAMALSYTQSRKDNIAVDILINLFSEKVRRALGMINGFVCMVIFFIAAWQISNYATVLMNRGEVTETLRFGYYPFVYVVAAGCGCLGFVFLCEVLGTVCELMGKDGQK